MTRESTVGSMQVRELLRALQALGADADALAARVRLRSFWEENPDARVPASRLLQLLMLAERALHDDLVGLHAGARAQPGGPLFYLLLSSPRVSEGLSFMARFARVPMDAQRMQVSVRDGIVELEIGLADATLAQSRHAIDYVVGANLSVLRRAIPDFRLLGVDLAHPEVGEPGETARVLRCPVRFARRRNVLRFPDTLLAGVPAAPNPAIAEQIERFTAAVLEQLTSADVCDRVSDVIRQLIAAGLPADRAVVAKRLHVSERTLQRQLDKESATFKDLRDAVRANLARALLTNRALKIETIADSVGFVEVSSFCKAFARWSGCTPTRYREMRLGGAPPERDADAGGKVQATRR